MKYHCPSGLPDAEEKAVQRLAVAAYRALDCRGWSRADLIIRHSDRKPFLIEMNTSPGMTTHSLVPMAARAVGLSYEALCAHLIASAALDPQGKGGKAARNERTQRHRLSMLLRQPAPPSTAPTSALPVDVRLMNAIAMVVFTLALVALLAAGLAWAARRPQFQFGDVRLEGDLQRNSVTTVRANAMPHLAGNFFTMDLAKTRAAFEQVPWVRHAVVRRVWPNRLVVALEEHQPVALWEGDENSDKMVNSHGEVFEANVGDVEDDSLPQFAGPDGTSAQVLDMYRRLQPLFAAHGRRDDRAAAVGPRQLEDGPRRRRDRRARPRHAGRSGGAHDALHPHGAAGVAQVPRSAGERGPEARRGLCSEVEGVVGER